MEETIILVLRYERLMFGNFCNCQKRNSIKILFGINNWFEERVKYAHFQGHGNYQFPVINNRHYALEYLFHYNQGLNSNKWPYLKSERSNSLKVYNFGMHKLRGIFWYVIYANWGWVWHTGKSSRLRYSRSPFQTPAGPGDFVGPILFCIRMAHYSSGKAGWFSAQTLSFHQCS